MNEVGTLYTQLSTTLADDLDIVKTFSLINTALAAPSPQDIYDILLFDDQILKI